MKTVRIFVSCPGDVGAERQKAREILDRLQAKFSGRLKIEPYWWEHEPTYVHADPQSQMEAQRKFSDLMTVFGSQSERNVPPTTEEDRLTGDDFDLEWENVPRDVVAEVIADETTVIHILDDGRYRSFDPVQQPALLTSDLFNTTFSQLLRWAENSVFGDRA